MKKIAGLLWQRCADETLAQGIREACAKYEADAGRFPKVALVHHTMELELDWIEVRQSQYISSPRLVLVGMEGEIDDKFYSQEVQD